MSVRFSSGLVGTTTIVGDEVVVQRHLPLVYSLDASAPVLTR